MNSATLSFASRETGRRRTVEASVANSGGGPSLPLSLAKPGSVLTVRKVRRGAAAQHLANLGFVEGAQVRVVNQTSTGTIVSVKGSRLGLDRDTARQVMCS